jgi:hypothetical protein
VEAAYFSAIDAERRHWVLEELVRWIEFHGGKAGHDGDYLRFVAVGGGYQLAAPGDWVVRNSDGEFYKSSARAFADMYVAAPSGAPPAVHELSAKLRHGSVVETVAQFLPPNGGDTDYAHRFAAWIKPHTFDVKHSQAGDALYVSTLRGPQELRYGWWLVKLAVDMCVVESPEEFAANYDIVARQGSVDESNTRRD